METIAKIENMTVTMEVIDGTSKKGTPLTIVKFQLQNGFEITSVLYGNERWYFKKLVEDQDF